MYPLLNSPPEVDLLSYSILAIITQYFFTSLIDFNGIVAAEPFQERISAWGRQEGERQCYTS